MTDPTPPASPPTSDDPPRRPRPVHPLDLLALLVAVVLAVVAYTYLFRTSPVPVPVDPLLGAEVVLEFPADRPWKKDFPEGQEMVVIEQYLAADVVSRPAPPADAPESGDRLRMTVRIRERDKQWPEGLTLFRQGIRRGTRLRLTDRRSEVQAEVITVRTRGTEE